MTTMTAGSTKLTTPTDREIRFERLFDAPRECVWRAFTEPGLVAQWWGRGNPLDIERDDVVRGGHWRYLEHGPEGVSGFEGRYREVTKPKRIARTFEWDGLPGHPSVEEMSLEATADGRTMLTATTLFLTREERDGMLAAGMEDGMNESYAALDRLLANICRG